MKYAVIGTGGIGGYFGGRLANAGYEVHFLFHNDYSDVLERGLRVDSVNGNFCIEHPHAYDDAKQMPLCDVVLVCLKTNKNNLLPELLDRVADEHSIVILIQNGIGVEEDVQNMLPHLQLVAGLAFICTSKQAPGYIRHQCLGRINFGNYSCKDETRLREIVANFITAGIPVAMVNYEVARWKKAVWNMPFNGMTVALNTQTDILLKCPATRSLIREQMMEIVRATRKLGICGVDEVYVEEMIRMTDAMIPYSPSMKLDYDNHRPMEISYLYSRPLAIARAAGSPMPMLEMLEAELKFIEQFGEAVRCVKN